MSVLFILIGVGIVVLGVTFWFRSRSFLARAVRTSGVIVDLQRERSRAGDGHGTVYRPIFRFTGPDGRDIVRRAGSASSHPRLRPGEPVTVLFDPQRPSEARIDTLDNRGPMAAVLTVIFGIVFAGIGVGMFTGVLH